MAAALTAALLPVSEAAVERLYSGVYAGLQPRLTSLSNYAPFALLDVLILTAAVVWIGLAALDFVRVRRPLRVVLRVGVRTIVWSAGAYLAFLLIWGFNYRRVRLVEALPFDAARVTPEAVAHAATIAVDRVNALYGQGRCGRGAGIGRGRSDGRRRAQSRPRGHRPRARRRPRPAEVDAARRVLQARRRRRHDRSVLPRNADCQRPAAVRAAVRRRARVEPSRGHRGRRRSELRRMAGVRSRARPRRSTAAGCFCTASWSRRLPTATVRRSPRGLRPGPRADLRAIRERFLRHVNPRVSAAGWRVYDSYLKANRVEAGAASYAEVVRLVVGARLPSGWEPLSP